MEFDANLVRWNSSCHPYGSLSLQQFPNDDDNYDTAELPRTTETDSLEEYLKEQCTLGQLEMMFKLYETTKELQQYSTTNPDTISTSDVTPTCSNNSFLTNNYKNNNNFILTNNYNNNNISEYSWFRSPFFRTKKSFLLPKSKRLKKNFSEDAKKILTKWYQQHEHHPYPTEKEKFQLSKSTGLTPKQISTWFSNSRRRTTSIKQNEQQT